MRWKCLKTIWKKFMRPRTEPKQRVTTSSWYSVEVKANSCPKTYEARTPSPLPCSVSDMTPTLTPTRHRRPCQSWVWCVWQVSTCPCRVRYLCQYRCFIAQNNTYSKYKRRLIGNGFWNYDFDLIVVN